VTKRKKKIILIQVLIFLLAVSLIYFTYYNKDNIKVEETNKPIIKQDGKGLNNVFEDVEYSGIDLNGNRYVIQSEYADFNLEKPELINMKIMKTIFYFKDGTILIVTGDYGKYNNKSNDIEFRSNVIAKYKDNIIFGDSLDFFNTKNYLTIYGNVKAEGIQGEVVADRLYLDLSNKTLDILMDTENKVNVKVRK
jgi:lipopolysaccharide assembly outer membrane protein LptD (OstA)